MIPNESQMTVSQMYKAIFMLSRGEGTSYEEFVEYWEEEHAPITIDGLSGLRKYVMSLPDDPNAAPYDGVAELHFDDAAACNEALNSEVMEEAVADVSNFADPDDIFQMTADEHTLADRM
jgi:uncharacterized protein (TIGR02118 family)